MIPDLTYTTKDGVKLKTATEWLGCSGCYFSKVGDCTRETYCPTNPRCNSSNPYIWRKDEPTLTERLINRLITMMKDLLS